MKRELVYKQGNPTLFVSFFLVIWRKKFLHLLVVVNKYVLIIFRFCVCVTEQSISKTNVIKLCSFAQFTYVKEYLR